MYSVIEQDSKQYKVSEGDSINIDFTDVSPDAEKNEIDKDHYPSCERFEIFHISNNRGDCIETVFFSIL